MDSSQNKLGFFKRIKIAIFKLEDYGMFLGERLTKSFKYFLLLILLVTLVVVIAGGYDFYQMLNKGINYIANEMPDFTYSDGNIKFDENTEAYDHDYEFKLYINTDDEVSEETLDLYKNDIYSVQNGIIVLKDKIIYIFEEQNIESTYANLFETYDIEVTNKEDLLNVINTLGISNILLVYGTSNLISMFIVNVLTILMDLVVVAIFGYIASRLCGIKFKLSPMITLSIYSLTLSILLSGIYNVVYILTGFVIKYFNIMYLLIAYVYIIAAIFMIKYDLIKQNEELQKIIEVQKQVRKEADEKQSDNNLEDESKEKEEKKDKKEEESPIENPKEEENREPDGSEI